MPKCYLLLPLKYQNFYRLLIFRPPPPPPPPPPSRPSVNACTATVIELIVFSNDKVINRPIGLAEMLYVNNDE
jgi:hypothetical protein